MKKRIAAAIAAALVFALLKKRQRRRRRSSIIKENDAWHRRRYPQFVHVYHPLGLYLTFFSNSGKRIRAHEVPRHAQFAVSVYNFQFLYNKEPSDSLWKYRQIPPFYATFKLVSNCVIWHTKYTLYSSLWCTNCRTLQNVSSRTECQMCKRQKPQNANSIRARLRISRNETARY